MQRRPTFKVHSARSRMDGCEWNGAEIPSQHVEPILVPNTVGVGTCPLEQATQTGSSPSGREAALLARDSASEQPGSAVESHAPSGFAQATSSAVWGPQQGSRPRAVLSRELRRSPRYQETHLLRLPYQKPQRNTLFASSVPRKSHFV